MSAETKAAMQAAIEAHLVDEGVADGNLEASDMHVLGDWIVYGSVVRPEDVDRAYYAKSSPSGPPHIEIGLAEMLREAVTPE